MELMTAIFTKSDIDYTEFNQKSVRIILSFDSYADQTSDIFDM